ncbi:winged helix-turn-helix domain-containing protein [Salinisphaera sp. RV14]|uniref:winged helix-turn-helix domain-containing protein n=1 Tax=Salinisphaera sp. RV14 TaxID=3454140 RepID=UPI003F8620DB
MNHPDLWHFEPALDRATHRWDGDEVRFTRAERALLGVFFSRPGSVLARDTLLDAISGLECEATDRSVDFIVHCLRKKLADSARDPLYIATRYGEGYVWIGPSAPAERPAAGAFIVVGPVHGLKFAENLNDRGWAFAVALAHRLDRLTPDERAVVLDADCPSGEQFSGDPPRFAVDLSFVKTTARGLDCVYRLRSFGTPVPIAADRLTITPDWSGIEAIEARAAQLAIRITGAIWASLQVGGPGPACSALGPLPVSLHAASRVMAVGCETWEDAARRLRRRLRENPADHAARIALATTLHSRYVLAGVDLLMTADERDENDAEIQSLVNQALPHLAADASHTFTAAKLLYFADKNNREQALSIAAHALETTAALAAGFTVWAQLQMWEGELDRALQFYDQALELSDHGTSFHIYLLVLKSQAAMALDPGGAAVVDELYSVKPATRDELGLFLAPTARIDLSPQIEATMAAMDRDRARASLRFMHYVTARHFRDPAHRRHVMRRPVALLVPRFGSDIVPADIRDDTSLAGPPGPGTP